MIGQLNVRIRVFDKAGALIKALSPDGNFIDRRIDFQNERRVLQGGESFLSVALVSHREVDAKMLDVEKIADGLIQNFTHKFSIVANDVKVVGILLQNL